MYVNCCVPGCSSSRQDAFLHKFPRKCEERLRKWLNSINCDSLRNKDIKELMTLQVCHKHFEARFITNKSRLLSIAYPTLFLQSEIDSGIPLKSSVTTEIVDPLEEHSYAMKVHYDHNYCKRVTNDSVIQNISASGNLASTSTYTKYQQEPMNLDNFMSKSTECQQEPIHLDSNLKRNKTRPSKKFLKVGDLTPRCRNLYTIYRKSRKQLSFVRRAKQALQYTKKDSFKKMTEAMNPLAQKILWMQINLCTKKDKGRRFSLDEKLIALSILKQGPKCYRFLQKIFILPSATTLKKMLSNLKVDSGINIQIFKAIKDVVENWCDDKKYCSIIFDEMALQASVNYTHKDNICGFVELPERKNQFADHVLVFMIKGIVQKWQQPIAFYFCEGATSSLKLKEILRNIITVVGETGLKPLAIVSDQGAAFQAALKSFQEDTRRSQILANKITDDTISIGRFNLSVIYDPPHLIKGLRNNFIPKNILYNNKIAKWQDIVDVYKTDCQHAETRLLHKLNDEHVLPEKVKKMKVKNCVRVFSKTMAAALNFTSAFSHYADGQPVSRTLKNTAEVVSFFDDIFDSVNGTTKFNKKRTGKTLRSAVTGTSVHHVFWQEAIEKLRSLKFVDVSGRETTVPSIRNWITTLKSMQRVWHFLIDNNIKIMRPRYMNSDAIENFFGRVRAYNCRDNNPTCQNFINTFKSLLITGFIKFHNPTFNCEMDGSNQLLDIKSLFYSNVSESQNERSETYKSCVVTYSVSQTARRERLTIQSRAYTAGWVVRKILTNLKCLTCKKYLTVEKSTEVHRWINLKEYKDISRNRLTYPAEKVVCYFGMIFEEAKTYLEANAHSDNIAQNIIKKIESKYTFDQISCQRHRDAVVYALLTITIKLYIHNWCTIINKILKGVDVFRLQQNSNLPPMQKKALDKYKKKLKIKCNK